MKQKHRDEFLFFIFFNFLDQALQIADTIATDTYILYALLDPTLCFLMMLGS